MLEHLRVANLGVLRDASVQPSSGFTVVTGETGAGKTLLLGGLRLLLGGPADARAVGPYSPEAQVDGLVTIGDAELGASRVVPAEGRSRAYLEGAIVSAATLGDRVAPTIDIVGQHDQLTITRAGRVLEMVDGLLPAEGRKALDAYQVAWKQWQAALERQEALGGDVTELARELDLARYQTQEISAAGLRPGLDDDLEVELGRLRNVEEIRRNLSDAYGGAEAMAEAVGAVVAGLRKAAALDPSLSDVASQSNLLADGVAELTRSVRSAEEGVADDPVRREELEQRLNAIGDLKRKYGRTLDDVLDYGARMLARVEQLSGLLDDSEEIGALVERARAEVGNRASALSAARSGAARSLSAKVMEHLADLGLGSARVEVSIEETAPGPSGADRVELHFSSDPRLQPGPVSTVASGGELSRLVLAIRLAARDREVDTLVFDEVDTGIGGKTALAMGEKMAALGRETQVLCVTHLAQVAAFADTHFVVDRGAEGVATVRQVDGPDRVSELSRMLAGRPDSDSGRTTAAELLALAGK